jgi:hypothetical protein
MVQKLWIGDASFYDARRILKGGLVRKKQPNDVSCRGTHEDGWGVTWQHFFPSVDDTLADWWLRSRKFVHKSRRRCFAHV